MIVQSKWDGLIGPAEKARKMKALDYKIWAQIVRGLFSPSPYKPESVAG